MSTPIRAMLLVAAATAAALAPTSAAGGPPIPARPDPPPNGQFDYQIGGSYKPVSAVKIVDRDRTAKPAAGFYNICYINAFQSQREEDRWWKKHHPGLLLHNAKGHLVEDPGWPGEYLLNTATAHSRAGLAKIEDGWLDGCKSKGFEAIEPDNLDSNTRSHGLLTRADNFRFVRMLIHHAHALGLDIAQKNSAEQSKRGARAGFDFAIAEECQVYNECAQYTKSYGNEVYEIEYTDNPRSAYTKACALRGDKISVILRDRNVTKRGSKHYHYEAC